MHKHIRTIPNPKHNDNLSRFLSKPKSILNRKGVIDYKYAYMCIPITRVTKGNIILLRFKKPGYKPRTLKIPAFKMMRNFN